MLCDGIDYFQDLQSDFSKVFKKTSILYLLQNLKNVSVLFTTTEFLRMPCYSHRHPG